jgi:hypothetical protein
MRQDAPLLEYDKAHVLYDMPTDETFSSTLFCRKNLLSSLTRRKSHVEVLNHTPYSQSYEPVQSTMHLLW